MEINVFLFFCRTDYDMATQRMCVQRGPSDSEDRCAHTIYNYKKVYMCFCQGDLCNAASAIGQQSYRYLAFGLAIAFAAWFTCNRWQAI